MWEALSGVPITDALLEWPPDLFALTDVILRRSEAYRLILSSRAGAKWPPSRFQDWTQSVEEAARQWSECIEDRERPLPMLLHEEWSVLRDRMERPLEDLADGRDWRLCEALLILHTIADEACAGLGVALDRSESKGCIYRARGRELLARSGSLARITSHAMRVLPKVRTPPNGTSFRSFSRYVCVRPPGVEARWHRVPIRRVGADSRSRHANLLLLPWPLRVREIDFRPVERSVREAGKQPSGLFTFAPAEGLDLDLLSRVILAAREEVDSVDVVVLPESAVDESEIEDLEALLDHHGVISLIAGVRQRSPEPGRLPGNWVHNGFNPRLEKSGSLPNSPGEPWFHIRQNKHHRWSLDESQIYQYHLGGALHPDIRWWEAMEVPRRALQFIELGDEITMASLVCEDLAQIDDVAEVIRSVGPTVVVTPLLDGPQLTSRWSSRYASVLADDPGSTILTLTSFGMVQRCRPHDRDVAPVVALSKDPVRGTREIRLEPGAQGILLTVCGDYTTRHSLDGRRPIENVTHYFDVAIHQVRAATSGSPVSNSRAGARTQRALNTDDLSVLTGWAQAVAETIAYAPQSLDALFANAAAGAPWRTALQIEEPSRQLGEAVSFIARVVRAATPPGGLPTFDDAVNACREDRPDATRLESLARRVLRSTLDQLRARVEHSSSNLNGFVSVDQDIRPAAEVEDGATTRASVDISGRRTL